MSKVAHFWTSFNLFCVDNLSSAFLPVSLLDISKAKVTDDEKKWLLCLEMILQSFLGLLVANRISSFVLSNSREMDKKNKLSAYNSF